MTSKDYILRDKALNAWWTSVVSNPLFDQLYLIMGIDIRNNCKSIDEVKACMDLLESLRTIAIADPPATPTAKSGIIHDMPKTVTK